MIHIDKTSGVSPRETELIAAIGASGLRVFTIADAARLTGLSRSILYITAHRLTQKKKLLRIEKSKYILIPPQAWKSGEYTEEGTILASQLVRPYALAYWTALSFHGWTEQISRTLFVQTTKQKLPVLVQGTTIRFVKLNPSRFFGLEEHWVGSQKVIVTNKEKTIVDCLDQPRYCGEIVEAAKGLWNGRKELDRHRLLEYALLMNNGAIIKRLGFLMDSLETNTKAFQKKLLRHVSPAIVPLDTGPKGPTRAYDHNWRIRANDNPANLTEWIRH